MLTDEHPPLPAVSTSHSRPDRRSYGVGTTDAEATRALMRNLFDQPHSMHVFPEPAVRSRALPHVIPGGQPNWTMHRPGAEQ